MPHATPLTDADRADLAAASPAWTLSADATAISRQFKGKNFTHAWAFMSTVAIEAEKLNHHPEWSNVYRTVDIRLTTHDTGGLSNLDAALAGKIDALAATLGVE